MHLVMVSCEPSHVVDVLHSMTLWEKCPKHMVQARSMFPLHQIKTQGAIRVKGGIRVTWSLVGRGRPPAVWRR